MTLLVGCALGLGMLLLASPFLWPAGRSAPRSRGVRALVRDRLTQAGLGAVSIPLFAAVSLVTGVVAAAIVFVVTPAVAFALIAGVSASAAPWLVIQTRAAKQRRARRSLWPDVVDHILSGVRAGLSLPDSLSALAHTGPAATRDDFARFEREWEATGSFARAIDGLKGRLADPSADRILETLRMAREVGGTELPSVLRSLGSYLRQDAAMRGEIEARQSWVRNAAKLGAIAPWVVLGLLATRAEAAAAYNSPAGIALIVAGGIAVFVAYRLMIALARLPEERRWFA